MKGQTGETVKGTENENKLGAVARGRVSGVAALGTKAKGSQ